MATKVRFDQVNVTPLYSDSYYATGQAAAGEYVNTVRKTYDVSSIPDGHIFIVTARNQAGDGAGLRNVNVSIAYNSGSYGQDTMGQYHQSVELSIPIKKVTGQNSVTVGFGGYAASQNWSTELQQIN